MNKLLKYSIAGSVLLMLMVPVGAQELWTTYGMAYSLPENLTVGLEFHNRFRDIAGYSNYKNATEINLEYRLTKHFKLGGAYRYTTLRGIEDSPDNDIHDDRQRYSIDLQAKLPLNSKLKLKNRSRYQLSLEDFGDPKRFYRNKSTLDIKLDKKTNFYFSEELFFRINKDKPMTNRLSCGFEYELTNKFVISPFYKIERKVKNFDVQRTYIVGVGPFLKL